MTLLQDIVPDHVISQISLLWFDPISYALRDGIWKSRSHRKGKPLHVTEGEHIFWRYFDVSWWTALFFLIGSCAWVINGAIAFHWNVSENATKFDVTSSTAFIGGTLFFFGGWTMYWEALNAERTAQFDIAVRRQEKNIINAFREALHCGRTARARRQTHWVWIGWDGGFRSISFMANFNQFCGTTVFWISVIAILFLPEDESSAQTPYYIFYWVPQVVGAGFLIISSTLLTLENQSSIFKPNLLDIGWHVGFWNLWGSIGFFLSGLFGIIFDSSHDVGRRWGVSFATYIGSCSFLLGSIIQYIEIYK